MGAIAMKFLKKKNMLQEFLKIKKKEFIQKKIKSNG